LSYIKGTSNKACVFNSVSEVIAQTKDYSELFEKVDATLTSMHPFAQPEDTTKTVKHILISNKGHICVDTIASKKLPKKQSLHKVQGEKVWKTFQNGFNPSQIAICQK
jgi:hypothetical protein